ncbi:hypothetical protein [Nitrosomonas communis]|uniref:hypothetical protein n=1 Tax=Nitrosomonas communis TaxID=44574 RepID=UPI0011153BA2|nr:hypothetical protein [Nitrosomonas communis]
MKLPHHLSGCGPGYCSLSPSVYERAVLDKQDSPSAGCTDGAAEALAIAKTPCPAPNWLVVPKPIWPPAAVTETR